MVPSVRTGQERFEDLESMSWFRIRIGAWRSYVVLVFGEGLGAKGPLQTCLNKTDQNRQIDSCVSGVGFMEPEE